MFLNEIPNPVILSIDHTLARIIFEDDNQMDKLQINIYAVFFESFSEAKWFYVEYWLQGKSIRYYYAKDLNEALYNYQDTLNSIKWTD